MRLNKFSIAAAALLASWRVQALNPPKAPDEPANSKPPASSPAPAPAPQAPSSMPAPAPPPAQAPAPAPVPAPAPAEQKSKKAAAAKPGRSDDTGGDDDQPSKKAPRRFIPTEKGKADEDIPYPVDI
jgi:hypothetical protein